MPRQTVTARPLGSRPLAPMPGAEVPADRPVFAPSPFYPGPAASPTPTSFVSPGVKDRTARWLWILAAFLVLAEHDIVGVGVAFFASKATLKDLRATEPVPWRRAARIAGRWAAFLVVFVLGASRGYGRRW